MIDSTALFGRIAFLEEENKRLERENERLEKWVGDLQSGMYVNCVYCGHRYGPEDSTSVSMADALREHVEQCVHHPMFRLREWQRGVRDGLLISYPPRVKGHTEEEFQRIKHEFISRMMNPCDPYCEGLDEVSNVMLDFEYQNYFDEGGNDESE